MINTINSDLIRGNINTIILKALYEGDRYGYDIVKEIEQKSSGQYQLKQPTLYSCLKRLEVQGFIRSYWGAKSNGGRRKYYTLTDMGREVFVKNKEDWEFSRTVIDKLISDRAYDLSEYEKTYEENNNAVSENNDDQDTKATALFSFDPPTIDDEQLYSNDESDSFYDELSVESEPDNFNINEDDSSLTANEQAEPKESQTSFFDTTEFLNNMFNTQQDESSYTDKLINEKYAGTVSPKGYSADTYFNDFNDTTTEDPASENTELASAEASAPLDDKFISYKTPIKKDDENAQILNRDYRNVLSQLVGGQNFMATNEISPTKTIQLSNKTSPLTDEMHQNIAKLEAKNRQRKTVDKIDKSVFDEEYAFAPSSKEDILSKNLTKMAEQTKQFTGDTVKNRVYDSRIDTIYRTQYHYYINKLRLFQFAILFAIMLIETAFVFLLTKVGLDIYQPHDGYFYLFGVLIAASFPIVAAIMNFYDADKIKTGEFRVKELKESLFYKSWVMVCFLIITYLVNIVLKMPTSFSKDYLATLLLPALLSLCFPISSVIFYFLYNSRRFNRE